MKNSLTVVALCLSLLVLGTSATAQKESKLQRANISRNLPLKLLRISPGFQIKVYANNVPGARQMALGTKGTVFVGTREGGNVYALVDKENDKVADDVYIIASGLKEPNGVVVKDGSLYVAERHRIIRFDNIEDNLKTPPAPVVVNDTLPDEDWHGWKYIAFGPDGKLYVPQGAPCNVCEKEDERYASIMRMNPDGSNLEVFAKGVRNTVGFDWHPETKELWFTDNGRDLLGDDIPPDELNKASELGMHFGFPYCHGKAITDPEFGNERKCDEFTPAERELWPHTAALGMKFYTGDMFPPDFKNKYIMVAEHGSWDRSQKIGYRVAVIQVIDNVASYYATFVDGWLSGDEAWGRPVDILQLTDGSQLVSDDLAGVIYRISY